MFSFCSLIKTKVSVFLQLLYRGGELLQERSLLLLLLLSMPLLLFFSPFSFPSSSPASPSSSSPFPPAAQKTWFQQDLLFIFQKTKPEAAGFTEPPVRRSKVEGQRSNGEASDVSIWKALYQRGWMNEWVMKIRLRLTYRESTLGGRITSYLTCFRTDH